MKFCGYLQNKNRNKNSSTTVSRHHNNFVEIKKKIFCAFLVYVRFVDQMKYQMFSCMYVSSAELFFFFRCFWVVCLFVFFFVVFFLFCFFSLHSLGLSVSISVILFALESYTSSLTMTVLCKETLILCHSLNYVRLIKRIIYK